MKTIILEKMSARTFMNCDFESKTICYQRDLWLSEMQFEIQSLKTI